jgi:glucokinase
VLTPAFDIGGTHVSAGLIDTGSWRIAGPVVRMALDAHAPSGELLDALAAAGTRAGAPAGAVWGVGMPDPFDYEHGVGRFHSVGKFEALSRVDVRAGLLARLHPAASGVRFVNDAEAFLLGEWIGAGCPASARWAAVTLGTGVGSASLVDGRLIDTGPDLPPGGRAHRFDIDGRPLEDVMSRRAIMAAYRNATGVEADVREIAESARRGDAAAHLVLEAALSALGSALARWLSHFDRVVVGGSMTQSWDILGPPLIAALPTGLDVVLADDLEASALIGAAYFAVS